MILFKLATLLGIATINAYDDASFKDWGTTGKFFYV